MVDVRRRDRARSVAVRGERACGGRRGERPRHHARQGGGRRRRYVYHQRRLVQRKLYHHVHQRHLHDHAARDHGGDHGGRRRVRRNDHACGSVAQRRCGGGRSLRHAHLYGHFEQRRFRQRHGSPRACGQLYRHGERRRRQLYAHGQCERGVRRRPHDGGEALRGSRDLHGYGACFRHFRNRSLYRLGARKHGGRGELHGRAHAQRRREYPLGGNGRRSRLRDLHHRAGAERLHGAAFPRGLELRRSGKRADGCAGALRYGEYRLYVRFVRGRRLHDGGAFECRNVLGEGVCPRDRKLYGVAVGSGIVYDRKSRACGALAGKCVGNVQRQRADEHAHGIR